MKSRTRNKKPASFPGGATASLAFLLSLLALGQSGQPFLGVVPECRGAARAADGIRLPLVLHLDRPQPARNDALRSGVVAVRDGKRRSHALLAHGVQLRK